MPRNSVRDLKQAKRFRDLLEKIGISQAELAKAIDMPPNTVSRWALGWQKPIGAVWAYLELRAKVKGLLE